MSRADSLDKYSRIGQLSMPFAKNVEPWFLDLETTQTDITESDI